MYMYMCMHGQVYAHVVEMMIHVDVLVVLLIVYYTSTSLLNFDNISAITRKSFSSFCSDSREGSADTGRLPPGRLCATECSESCSSRGCPLRKNVLQEAHLRNRDRLRFLREHCSLRSSGPFHSIVLLPNV